MITVYGYWGEVVRVSGNKALFQFTHPSEPAHKQRMWVDARDAGVEVPKPIVYDGGGIVACHACGCAHGECECD